MRKVCVIGPDYAIKQMFLRRGWEVVSSIDENTDLIQFTGGEDVDPSYYGQTKHPATYSNPARDAREVLVYNEWVGKIPMAGICRGGQLLNVLNGGGMWQHVSNHGIRGTHEAVDVATGNPVMVTSTHHQMMIPSTKGKVLMTAKLAQVKQTPTDTVTGLGELDTEAVLYSGTRSLCYQPHPEDVPFEHECQEIYFSYLNQIL